MGVILYFIGAICTGLICIGILYAAVQPNAEVQQKDKDDRIACEVKGGLPAWGWDVRNGRTDFFCLPKINLDKP